MKEVKLYHSNSQILDVNLADMVTHTWHSEQWSSKGVRGDGSGRGGSWQYWPRHPDTHEQL